MNTKQYTKSLKNNDKYFFLGKLHLNTNNLLQYEKPTEFSHLSLPQYSENLGPLIYYLFTPSSNGTYEILRKIGRTKNWAKRIYTYQQTEKHYDYTTQKIINELIKLKHYTIHIYGIQSPPNSITITDPNTNITKTVYQHTTEINEQFYTENYISSNPNNIKTLTFQTQINI